MATLRFRLRSIIFPTIAILITLIIALALLEFFFWLFLHQKWRRHPQIPINELVLLTPHGRRLKPNLNLIRKTLDGDRNFVLRTNSFGLRGKQVAFKKPTGVKRILVLGDSVTFAVDLPEEDTYVGRIEKLLSARSEVEVINSALPDVGLKEEVWLLKETGLKLEPDLVMIAFYLNDSRPPWGFEGEYMRLPSWLIEISTEIIQYSYFYKWFWNRVLVTRFRGHYGDMRLEWGNEYGRNEWRTDRAAFQRFTQYAYLDWGAAWDPNSWKVIYPGFYEALRLGRKNNFKLAILIFPVEMQVRSEVADDYPQKMVQAFCGLNAIPCLDLLPILQEHKDEVIYFDHCHLSALGHQLIAPVIAEFIERNGLLPLPSGQK